MEIAVITGASSGIGKEFALAIDREYPLDEIWLIARRKERLAELASELGTNVRILEYGSYPKREPGALQGSSGGNLA